MIDRIDLDLFYTGKWQAEASRPFAVSLLFSRWPWPWQLAGSGNPQIWLTALTHSL